MGRQSPISFILRGVETTAKAFWTKEMSRFRSVPGFTQWFNLGRVLDEHRGYKRKHWESLERRFREMATALLRPFA